MPPSCILHADAFLVAADKPAGLLAVPGRGADKQDCLWARVRAEWPDALVVHRLDQATSGVMLFARGALAQRTLSAAFEQRRVAKRYEAVVAGSLADDAGTIDLPLAADWPRRPRQQVDRQGGKASLTHWRVLSRDAATTRLALEPVTGRSHQLRVHCAAIGHPIVGDALYGCADAAAPRLLLHAKAVTIAHPLDGTSLHVECPTPF
ncbi:MAG TPA: RluA family pseudouridine synthase [Burkholderiaceae bacterium]|nr:RluA family pseudouridine synthase [Burkholderiaceae bacterium]